MTFKKPMFIFLLSAFSPLWAGTDIGGGDTIERIDFRFCQTPRLVLDQALENSALKVNNFSNFQSALTDLSDAFTYILDPNNKEMKGQMVTLNQKELTLFGLKMLQHLKQSVNQYRSGDEEESKHIENLEYQKIFITTYSYVVNVLIPIYSVAEKKEEITLQLKEPDNEFLRARKLLLNFLEKMKDPDTKKIPHYPTMYLHVLSLVASELAHLSEASLFNHRDACELIKLNLLAQEIMNYLNGQSVQVRRDQLQQAWRTYQKRFDDNVNKMNPEGLCPIHH
jgi:hypothetical protein